MFVNKRFYICLLVVVLCFIAGYPLPILFTIAKIALLVFVVVCIYDFGLLFFTKGKLKAIRTAPKRFSNGDPNEVTLTINSSYHFNGIVTIIDEIPKQFQKRDFQIEQVIPKDSTITCRYTLTPTFRGEYRFGLCNLFIQSPLGLFSRRFKSAALSSFKVYPSFIRLKEYALMAASNQLVQAGSRKVPKIGLQLEPDHIKEYVQGDDYRFINWNATARRNKLMVNVFREQKEQNIYCVIDKGRTMRSAFEKMTFLDYSINASLALLYITMNKGDKAGLITFEKEVNTFIPASRSALQLHTIMDSLYNQKTSFIESDFEALYTQLTRNVKNRSLLLFFTNFDSEKAMERQLPYLAQLAKTHSVVVLFFENAETQQLIDQTATTKEGIYQQVVAEKLEFERNNIIKRLRRHNIVAIKTHPNNLTVNSINQYLKIKHYGNL